MDSSGHDPNTAAASDERESRELALLRLVDRGGGEAGWHELETKLARLAVPRRPGMMAMLKELETAGLVRSTARAGKSEAWALTDKGTRFLEEAARHGWPLGPLEAETLAQALAADLPQKLAAIRPFMEDRPRLAAVLRQLLTSGADPEKLAYAAQYLDEPQRVALAREWRADPRPEVRSALFRAWAPVDRDVPGRGWRSLPEDEWDAHLREGLLDPDRRVRENAAVLAYGTNRGAAVVGELLANVGAPEPALRAWAVLALGSADDAISRDVLQGLLAGEDEDLASAAVRALAARPDGHPDWLRALDDARDKVRTTAMFALAHIVSGLTAEEVSRLEHDTRAQVREAAGLYRARDGRSPGGEAR